MFIFDKTIFEERLVVYLLIYFKKVFSFIAIKTHKKALNGHVKSNFTSLENNFEASYIKYMYS